ncbi:putative 3-hydroxyacyl-CoA dehydrogenase [Elsinoe ampelina]|uniref:Putative 3-hydroxyacyl-CoA dehydrogenase n=1 Tax=Elsinoe ampelina TaxID=302913 RepID=A0A6A6GKP7_9PEZI|nr:putative 3-hydroxyacyl-CoA dehydrogenase [Elsinoe ampelina]
MTEYHPPSLSPLKDKVCVITGGASGMAADLVRLCHSVGAHVFFGDIIVPAGEAVEAELKALGRTNHARFVPFDAASYKDNLHLFDVAFQTCGRVDHAVSAAGVTEMGDLTDPGLTLETVREEPPANLMKVLEIDLTGPLYFSRVASVYLRQPALNDKSSTAAADKSLTLVSSIAGITEAPGLPVYSAAKHGVVGLMRSLRVTLMKELFGRIRTNAILPWMTKTRMVKGVEKGWAEAGLPTNEPVDVAKIMAGVMADGESNGFSLFVGGGRAFETEAGYDRTQPQWFGEMTEVWLKGQEVLGSGNNWQAKP